MSCIDRQVQLIRCQITVSPMKQGSVRTREGNVAILAVHILDLIQLEGSSSISTSHFERFKNSLIVQALKFSAPDSPPRSKSSQVVRYRFESPRVACPKTRSIARSFVLSTTTR